MRDPVAARVRSSGVLLLEERECRLRPLAIRDVAVRLLVALLVRAVRELRRIRLERAGGGVERKRHVPADRVPRWCGCRGRVVSARDDVRHQGNLDKDPKRYDQDDDLANRAPPPRHCLTIAGTSLKGTYSYPHHLGRQLGDPVEDDVRVVENVCGRRVVRVRDRDHAHPRSPRGADPVRRVLDRGTALRRDP